jgi:hypothetical protein
MEKKVCSKCKEEKELCDFSKLTSSKDGHNGVCKTCRKITLKRYNENNVEKIKLSKKLYSQKNIEKEKTRKKEWKKNNLEYFKEYRKKNYNKEKNRIYEWKKNNKEKFLESHKIWKEKNKKEINYKKNQYKKNRIKNDPLFKLKINMRGRIYKIIKNKSKNSFYFIGCSCEFLKEHIEKQFKDGMSWDNYSFFGWHIDHIIPLSSASNQEELVKLCHYTNLQPLWADNNWRKSNKIL